MHIRAWYKRISACVSFREVVKRNYMLKSQKLLNSGLHAASTNIRKLLEYNDFVNLLINFS